MGNQSRRSYGLPPVPEWDEGEGPREPDELADPMRVWADHMPALDESRAAGIGAQAEQYLQVRSDMQAISPSCTGSINEYGLFAHDGPTCPLHEA